MAIETELLQCPFCGNKPTVSWDDGRLLIDCPACLITKVGRDTWNSRSEPATPEYGTPLFKNAVMQIFRELQSEAKPQSKPEDADDIIATIQRVSNDMVSTIQSGFQTRLNAANEELARIKITALMIRDRGYLLSVCANCCSIPTIETFEHHFSMMTLYSVKCCDCMKRESHKTIEATVSAWNTIQGKLKQEARSG